MIEARLKALGFTDCEMVGDKRGVQIFRIRTDKGWTYERFESPADVDAWAVGKAPA